jgi:hypothetical protein
VERARHAADTARRRYLAVDPDNRLVAANLEADWNEALRTLTAAHEDYERQSARAAPLDTAGKARIAALASDFPALWSDPRTPQRERKRMVRLLIADVTLTRTGHRIAVQVRFKAGQTTSIEIDAGLPAYEARRTPPGIVAEINRLLDDHTEAGVAEQLNHSGLTSGTGQKFQAGIIHHIRVKHQLASREERLRKRGLVPLGEAAESLGVCTTTVKVWHHEGRLAAQRVNQKGVHYYQIPAITPRKATGRPPGSRNRPKQ